MSLRRIALVTSARSDLGFLDGLMRAISADSQLELTVCATGMHHSIAHGQTIDEIRALVPITSLVELPVASDGDEAVHAGRIISAEVLAFTELFAKQRPDILVVLGDRYDMMPAVITAQPFRIPVAHISGGDITEGVIDDAIRHAVSKLSHLHFVYHPQHRLRLMRMGEEEWRIILSGNPSMDSMAEVADLGRTEALRRLSVSEKGPVSLITYHPETLDSQAGETGLSNLMSVARAVPGTIVFTAPNADPGHGAVTAAIQRMVSERPATFFYHSLGRLLYVNAMRYVDCMVGNSSSGLVEAASFKLPVVNVGNRQKGRLAPDNVIHVAANGDIGAA